MVERLLRVLERSRWLAICMGVLALLGLTLGTSAAASHHTATTHVGAAAQTPCVPAEQLNGKELAARLAWMKAHNGVFRCTPSSTVRHAGADITAIPQAASPDSDFYKCNKPTGGATIACFAAHNHFAGMKTFKLSSIQLQDTLDDSRSAFTDIYDDWGWTGIEFENSNGPHTTKDFPDKSFTAQQAHVQFVYVRVFACNSFGCSTGQNSLKHYNPF